LLVTHELEGFPRNAKTAFHLRAHGHIMNIFAQRVLQETVQHMPTVLAGITSGRQALMSMGIFPISGRKYLFNINILCFTMKVKVNSWLKTLM
jgi:hypothetical protein